MCISSFPTVILPGFVVLWRLMKVRMCRQVKKCPVLITSRPEGSLSLSLYQLVFFTI